MKFSYCLILILILDIGFPVESITPAESIQLKSIFDVQVSPDGKSALYSVSQADEKQNYSSYDMKIYQVELGADTNAKLLIPALKNSFRPRWSPAGNSIAFLTPEGNKYGLYLIDVQKNEIKPLFSGEHNVQTFAWSPDGKKIAFVTNEKTSEKSGEYNRLRTIDVFDPENTSRIYTSGPYCVRGFGEYGQMTEEFSWSPDGQKIVFAYSPSCALDKLYLDSSLAILDIPSGLITPIEKRAQHESMPIYSPDGSLIAYLASEPPNYALNKSVNLLSSDGKVHRSLPTTFNCGADLCDSMLKGWTKDSSHIIFFEPNRTKYRLLFLPITGGAPREIDIENRMLQNPCINVNGRAVGFVMQNCDLPQEAYVSDLETFNPVRITQLNKDLKNSPVAKTEIVDWKSSDGLKIEGLLTYPKGYRNDRTYPLILMIHGGPMSFFDESYIGNPCFYCVDFLAENGFLVLRPNPRGSTGYGKVFRGLNFNDWGGKDLDDLMTGVDELVKSKKADPEKLGVMGWSYGGYMAARVITQTNRFKAAILGAGIYNLVSFAGTCDLPRFTSSYLGEFWDNPELYRERSPIYYANKVTTPCLMIHGTSDLRVPTSQSHEFYRALKKNGQTVKMILIPDMGHACSRPGKLMEIMQENLDWFKKYLD